MVSSHQFIILKRLKKYIVREWELKQCLKTIKLVVTILVSAKANETRLNNLILLIAISYTLSSFEGEKIKNKGLQEYISRTNERGRKERRNSSFCLGLSSIYWAINDDLMWKLVENLMSLNPHKLLYYRRGIKAMNKVVN